MKYDNISDQEPLTTGDVADYCHVSLRTVLFWIEEGKLHTYKTPGGHNRIKRSEFMEFMKKHEMPIPARFIHPEQRKKILIVDDDRNMVNALVRMLKRENRYDLDTAFDGFDAGRKILEFMPDIVILDIRMPGVDGYAVTKRIKLIPHDRNIKIIAVSAFFEEEGKNKILSFGADACLDKPFDNDKLVSLLDNLLK